ncbi:MAG: FG-GAP-like repeat-containing protein [Chloroflexota bacterium]
MQNKIQNLRIMFLPLLNLVMFKRLHIRVLPVSLWLIIFGLLLLGATPVLAGKSQDQDYWRESASSTTIKVAHQKPLGDVDYAQVLTVSTKLSTFPIWRDDSYDGTGSLAWGDIDGDGDLDLAMGNSGSPNKVYRNQGGILEAEPIPWNNADGETNTTSVAWGDIDGDGDLDLAVGNSWRSANKVYLNEGGVLEAEPIPWDNAKEDTQSVAWGDIDGDGDLDLAVGNWESANKVYLNEGGILEAEPIPWDNADDKTRTTSVAWGDMDGDGDLDLAVGNWESANKVYLNEGGMLKAIPVWEDAPKDGTDSVAWGDIDGDGDLDLAVGNQRSANKVYLNEGGVLKAIPVWEDNIKDTTRSVAWGDIDGDGDLDLAVGNADPSKVYLNEGEILEVVPIWLDNADDKTRTTSVAWGDIDGDGDLDLAVGNSGSASKVYLNENSILESISTLSKNTMDVVHGLAWGDMDGDGDLDLALGNAGPNEVHLNEGGMLEAVPIWSDNTGLGTTSVAWGDIDGDGDLDLAVGNQTGANNVHLNEGGILEVAPTWSDNTNDVTTSVAWGDIDGDGDLDLAVGNQRSVSLVGSSVSLNNEESANKVYLNEGGTLKAVPIWSDSADIVTNDVAWGDMDGDGDLDLAVGNSGPNKVYRNEGGTLKAVPIWSDNADDVTNNVAWGDMDGDGDLDLAVGNWESPNKVYRNNRISKHPLHQKQSYMIALSDNANFYATSEIEQTGKIPISYSLFSPGGIPVAAIRVTYSPDGGGRWYEAKPTADTQTVNLTAAAYPTVNLTNTHVYTWDVFASSFFGQSDNVVLRFEALPFLKTTGTGITGTFKYFNLTADSYQQPNASTQTFPIRVRGNQVRVMRDTIPVSNALVYRLPAAQLVGAEPLIDRSGQPFLTNQHGYLQGRGEINAGDNLVALVPISSEGAMKRCPSTDHLNNAETQPNGQTSEVCPEPVHTIQLFHTSTAPIDADLASSVFQQVGVHTLTVSADNPLLLFNLDVSVEWDAHEDEAFLTRLNQALKRTSELLYDWTNGQAALGQIQLYHDQERWQEADIRIYATNRLRPNATQGGIVTETVTIKEGADVTTDTLTYSPGQVHMNSGWNRFGEAEAGLGEDWARALAHELGHYLFYLDDNYLGLEADRLILVDDCPGAMSDPYRDDASSEFHPVFGWTENCEKTLSHQLTGRSDWETITKFYDSLKAPDETEPITSNQYSGPHSLPLAVTQLVSLEPAQAEPVLTRPHFNLQDVFGSAYQANRNTRAFLFQSNTSTTTRLIDLGSPIFDQVTAWGSRPGDELCVYDLAANFQGCQVIEAGQAHVTLNKLDPISHTWHPDVIIQPEGNITLTIEVTGTITLAEGESLVAQFFNLDGKVGSSVISLTNVPNSHKGTFILDEAVLGGYIRVWVVRDGQVSEPRREAVIDFALGGNPVPTIKPRPGNFPVDDQTPWSQRLSFRQAPVVSPDGQVTLFGKDLVFERGQYFALQSTSVIPNPPPWGTVVGQAYRLIVSDSAPDLDKASISFSYLPRDVPFGEDQWLTVYYLDQQEENPTWQRIETDVNVDFSQATALAQGPGLYMLMSSTEIPLEIGWNLIAYPIQENRPVGEALSSLLVDENQPLLGEACGYDAQTKQLVPITELEFGKGYWIKVGEAAILRLKAASGMPIQTERSDFQVPCNSTDIPAR